MKQSSPISVDAPTAIIAALALSAIGAIFYNILPLFIGVTQDFRGWNNSDTGLLGASFFLGYTVVTISAFFWVRKIDWRKICLISLSFAAVPMIAAVYYKAYWLNILFVIISGGAFSAIYVVGTVAIGDTSNPARWYGAKIGGETGLGGLFLLLSPSFIAGPYGFNGVVVGLAIVALLSLLFLSFLPPHGVKGEEEQLATQTPMTSQETFGIWLTLTAVVIFFLGETAIWSFVERIGATSGFDPQYVGYILAASLVTAMLGALSEAFVGDRFGYRAAFTFSLVLFVIGTVILYLAKSIILYGVGTLIVMYSVGFGVPVIVAAIAILDRGGRYIVLSVPALGIGAMFGPGIAGILLDTSGTIGLLILTFITAILSYFLIQKGVAMARLARGEGLRGVQLNTTDSA